VRFNRLGNIHNFYQQTDKYKRVLVACSAGMLRSPTVAMILTQDPFNFNTRAVGLDENYALIPMDKVMLEWADEVVVMESAQKIQIEYLAEEWGVDIFLKPIHILGIADEYGYRNPELIEFANERCNSIFFGENK